MNEAWFHVEAVPKWLFHMLGLRRAPLNRLSLCLDRRQCGSTGRVLTLYQKDTWLPFPGCASVDGPSVPLIQLIETQLRNPNQNSNSMAHINRKLRVMTCMCLSFSPFSISHSHPHPQHCFSLYLHLPRDSLQEIGGVLRRYASSFMADSQCPRWGHMLTPVLGKLRRW